MANESSVTPLDRLSPEERAAVERRLRGLGSKTIPRRTDDGPAPLSSAQERLWFLDQLFPDSLAYNIPSGYRLRGPLDIAALRRALTDVVRRHHILRSTFGDDDGVAVQTVGTHDTVELPVVDVPGGDVAERLIRAAELARTSARRPFDLRTGPLIRAELLTIGTDDHVLVLCFHHIVSDHWSLGILLRELSTLYEAYLSGLGSPLAEPSLQYPDFVAWHREWLSGGVLDRQESYWREQLTGLVSTRLPVDRDWPDVQTFDGTRIRVHLSASETDRLAELVARHDATLFVALSAAVAVILARHSGQSDISFSSVIANRRRPELEDMVGFFANTLMLRLDTSGCPSFEELLTRTREVTLGAYEHQDLPFEKLVQILSPDRDLRQMPLAGVVMSFLNVPSVSLRLPAVSVEEFFFDPGTAKFGVDIVFAHGPDGLAIDLDFRDDLFSRAAMESFSARLVRVLAAVSADPALRLADVPLLNEDERASLLAWSAGPAVAVFDGQRTLSDGDLEEGVERLAQRLRAFGLAAEEVVAISVKGLADLVVAAPTDNVTCYVLDQWGGLAPPGVPGELAIGGAGVARGSRGLPELTAERFVPNPFGAGTVWRTGSTARWRTDGVLELVTDPDSSTGAVGQHAESVDPDVGPADDVEARLAAIWTELLPVDHVGMNDNFFGLGGHSLLATRMLTKVRQEFGTRLSVRALFDNPTLSAFSAELAKAEES